MSKTDSSLRDEISKVEVRKFSVSSYKEMLTAHESRLRKNKEDAKQVTSINKLITRVGSRVLVVFYEIIPM